MLGTIDTLKQAVGIPVGDTSRDAALTVALSAASEKLLGRCRYSEDDVTAQVDYLEKLKYNRKARLELRPVANVVVEGRALGQTNEDWTPLVGDVLNPAEGVFLVLGAQNWWPPTQQVQPRFMKWRDPEWPIIRVTYDVAGLGADVPDDLQQAVYALAGYWYERIAAGASSSEQAGQLKRTFMDAALPAWVEPMLSRHLKGSYATWR